MAAIIQHKTKCGRILKPEDCVKLGHNGTAKIPGHLIGKVIQRRNKRTGFTNHFVGPLGEVWVKFGRRIDNTEKIVALSPILLEYIIRIKRKRGSVNKLAEIDSLDIGDLV